MNNRNSEDNKINYMLRRIYEMITLGIPLNEENLLFYKIDKDDIKELLSKSLIVYLEQDKNQYTVKDLDNLYQYGIKLSVDKQYLKSTRCFYKCYESEPNNREYCLRMLLIYLKENCYQKAMSMFLHIETIETDRFEDENIIYLYLLNMLIHFEDRYIEKIKNFDPDALMYNDKVNHISEEYCNIRRAIYINKFKYAYQLLMENMHLYRDYSIESKLLKELLNNVINKEELIKRKLRQSIKKEMYLDVIDILNELKKCRYLNSNEKYIYLITESIINIKNTRIIPDVSVIDTIYLYDAIKGNNFIKAKELNEEYLIKLSKDVSNDLVNILLDRINNLILQIEFESIYDDFEEDIIEEDNDNIEIIHTDENTNKELVFAEEIAYYIKSENMSIEYAKKYLGIVPSQILLIKLIYARDYFIEGLDELGNKLLKEVEKSKDKTTEVITFLNEIRRDKKFYKNRYNNDNMLIKKYR